MIPEIHIWRVANLMIKPYGNTSEVESARPVDELRHAGDTADVAVWCPIIDAVDQPANTMPPGLVQPRLARTAGGPRMATDPVHPDTQKLAEQGCGSLQRGVHYKLGWTR
jgi:hypothetical protein